MKGALRVGAPEHGQPVTEVIMPKHRQALPPLAELQEFFENDPVNGALVWSKSLSNRAPAGSRAGAFDADGYLIVKFKKVIYKVHRIAYFLGTKNDPGHLTVDHKNGDFSDNRLVNLRLATRLQQVRNRKSKGYTWDKNRGKWSAGIGVSGKRIHLGRFDTKEEAAAAYQEAATAYFGLQ